MIGTSGAANLEHYANVVADSHRWEAYRHRPGDIIIATAAKSGTTWMQMLCALLIFRDRHLPGRLDEISPWLDQKSAPIDAVIGSLERQTHRRFIKTHTPLDGLPYFPNAYYICVGRHPLEVAASFIRQQRNLDTEALARSLGEDVDRVRDELAIVEREGVEALCRTLFDAHGLYWAHALSAWNARHRDNVALMHYSNLKADLPGQMMLLAEFLAISIEKEACRTLSAYAGFDYMKANASSFAPHSTQKRWKSDSDFFTGGRPGGDMTVLTEECLEIYHRQTSNFPEDMVHWLETGRSE